MKIFRSNPSSFFRWFLIVLLTPLMGVIAFNVIVDPYWYFNIVNIKNFNAIKSQATHRIRMTKAHQVVRQKPTNIILGTSRVEIAFDPGYAAWDNFPGTTYNMGLAGLGIEELYKTFKHAYYASKNLKLMLVALDFLMFNAHREAVVFGTEVMDFEEARLLLSPKDSYLRSFLYDLDYFIGNKATLASWHTLYAHKITDGSKLEFYLKNGMRDPVNNMLGTVTNANGHNFVFSGQERAYVDKIWRAGPAKRYCSCLKDRNTMETFRKIVAFAYDSNIDLRLFIAPEHARMLLAIKEAGLWVQFEEWKQDLVRIIDEEAQRYNKATIALWDFSGFNSVTTEAIPSEGDKTTSMRWYWEGSHYKQQTGNAILDRVLAYQGSGQPAPADFGIQLSAKNLQTHLDATRYQMAVYEKNFPKEAKFIKTVVDETLSKSDGSNCGHDFEQLKIAENALKNGDASTAKIAFDKAKEIHQFEKARACKLDVPFREDKFFTHLATIQSGQEVELTPHNWIAYQERGIGRKAKGDLAGAIADYTEAITVGPRNSALLFLRGTTLAEMGQYNLAIADYNAILAFEPNNETIKFLLKQSEGAIAGQKMDEQLNSWMAYQDSGNQKVKSGDLAGAVLDFTEAINRGPKSSALHYLRGSTLAQMNEHHRAIQDFEAILAVEPENITVKHLLSKSQLYLAENKQESLENQ